MYTLFRYIELESRKTGPILELTDGGRPSFSIVGYIETETDFLFFVLLHSIETKQHMEYSLF